MTGNTDFPYTTIQLAWLHDLETTEAKQGRRALHTEDEKYCCLGRACVVLGKSPSKQTFQGNYSYDGVGGLLLAYGDLGLRSSRGVLLRPFDTGALGCSYGGSLLVGSLTEMNDSGWTFKDIAAAIRADPSNFFTNLEPDL